MAQDGLEQRLPKRLSMRASSPWTNSPCPTATRFPTVFGAKWTKDNAELASRSDIVIVSVRPHDLPAVRIAGGKLIISVMAGITLAELSRHFRTDRVVRTIPNAAAECRKSYTPWVASDGVTASDREIVRRILEACGSADEVKTEMDIDYFTGVTGSGPAFPALLAEAMMEDAIKRGISPEVACRSVNAVLIGAGRLIENHGERPEDIVQTFVDYGGTTAAAIAAMRNAGFNAAVHKGLEAALQKSLSMGKAISRPRKEKKGSKAASKK